MRAIQLHCSFLTGHRSTDTRTVEHESIVTSWERQLFEVPALRGALVSGQPPVVHSSAFKVHLRDWKKITTTFRNNSIHALRLYNTTALPQIWTDFGSIPAAQSNRKPQVRLVSSSFMLGARCAELSRLKVGHSSQTGETRATLCRGWTSRMLAACHLRPGLPRTSLPLSLFKNVEDLQQDG